MRPSPFFVSPGLSRIVLLQQIDLTALQVEQFSLTKPVGIPKSEQSAQPGLADYLFNQGAISGQEMRPCCNMRFRNRQTAPATPPKSCFMHSEIHYQCEQTIHPLRSWKEGCFNNPFRDERSASATLLFQ